MAKKYLIIQTAFIGDVILATSLIENLKRANPATEIDVLVKKENQSILKDNPHIHELFLMDKSKKLRSMFSIIFFKNNPLCQKIKYSPKLLKPPHKINI